MQSIYDYYTSFGSNNLRGCWTPDVSKYDPSSFYNWEQDNLPVYDLEERTALLWERLGNPTSAVNGFAMVVSGDATSSCNSNVFTSLSACLQRLPEVINSPVIIEIASFGNLGDLVLSNKTFGPRGSIEIINRVYGKGEGSLSASYGLSYDEVYLNNAYNLASSITADPNLVAAAGGIFTIPSISHDFSSTSSYVLGCRVLSSMNDARLTNNTTVFARRSPDFNNRLTASIASKNSLAPFANLSTSFRTQFTPYETNTESWDSISSYDASCIDETSNNEIIWKNSATPLQIVNALVYGNKASSVKIYNCNGPIYIRNITVDGGGYGGLDYGFDIRNSSVFLENCSVSRCTKAGLYGLNSKITILRSFVAYRNYGFNSVGVREGGTWLNKIKTSAQDLSSVNYAAGVLVVGSELNFSSTFSRDNTYFMSSISTYYPIITAAGLNVLPAASWLLCLSRNDIGLKAVNSRISGGKNEKFGFGVSFYNAHQLILELNSEAGMVIDDSEVDHSGKLHFYGNFRGLDCKNSSVKIDSVIAKYNQKEACRLINSRLKYNKDMYIPYFDNTVNLIHQSTYMQNGTHIKLDNSIYEPTECSSMPTFYGRFVASGNFGVTQSRTNQLGVSPAFIVDSNSTMRLVHAAVEAVDSYTESGKGGYGAAFYVNNNSELILQGSKNYCTRVVGPTTYALQKRKSGLYANNNSNIKIQGPTLIARYAVDALAENSSKIEFTPHKTETGQIDVSGFNLTDRLNHTSVELHSTRACLVADNGSYINMEDLGDYRKHWAVGSYGTAALLSGIDYLTTEGSELSYQTYTSGGSMQFYPNPNDSAHYGPALADPTPVGTTYTKYQFDGNANYNYLLMTNLGSVDAQTFSAVTNGGMCVRALNGSKVNVDNVHFPCGWWNPSGIIYDMSGTESGACNKLFIWNIADLSQLDAKLTSVSGLHPADASYFGPSGVWGSASSAPTGTPDTSSVSILDYYGRSTNHLYSRSTATNQGPFRLYFSVDPVVNWALNDSQTYSGYIPQVYSQGYQFSGNLIFPGTVSSFYTSIVRKSGNSLVASGFYYASSMVESPATIRALLDDSAANTFANAKHNTVGKSGLARLVSMYFPYTDVYGGDSAKSSTKQYGKGVKSVNTFDLEKDN